MYMISNGVIIESEDKISDLRLSIEYRDKILSKLLFEIKYNSIVEIDSYLNTVDTCDQNKKIIKKYFDFCKNNKLIKNKFIVYDTSIWRNSRLMMTLEYICYMTIWALPIVPIILINNLYFFSYIDCLTNLYLVHLFIITMHELSHALSYWLFQKKINGYFSIDLLSTYFCYNDITLKRSMKVCVALSGMLFSLLLLYLIYSILEIDTFIIVFEFAYQVISFLLGTDLNIIIEALNT